MKLTINSAELNNAINVLSVVNTKVSQPVLENFLFSHKNGVVRMMSSCGVDMDACYLLQATNFEGEGKFCVDGKLLASAVKGLSAQDIVLGIDLDTLEATITHSYGVIRLKCTSCESYPERISMPSEALSTMVSFLPFSSNLATCVKGTATDETRPVMNGVNLEFHGDHYTMVGTDGRRLYAVKQEAQCIDNVSIIVPKATAKVIAKCRNAGVANIRIGGNYCDIRIDSKISLRFKGIDGRYPNWRAVIPRTMTKAITANANALKASVQRVSNFGDSSSRVLLRISDGNKMTISATNNEYLFSSEETISLCDTNMSKYLMGVSAPFLAEILGMVESENVTILCEDMQKPSLTRECSDGRTFLTLLMPMKIDTKEEGISEEDCEEVIAYEQNTTIDDFDLPVVPTEEAPEAEPTEEAPETGAVIINGVKIAEYEHHSIEV